MKKNKVLLTKTGDTYNCRYVLDQTDIIDEKVDKGVSGKFPQIIPCRLEEKDNQREFIYEIDNKVQLNEFLKKEINKKQMLTLLYNLFKRSGSIWNEHDLIKLRCQGYPVCVCCS